jgi:hypothetical protein
MPPNFQSPAPLCPYRAARGATARYQKRYGEGFDVRNG